MARPAKFKHDLADLSQPHIAAELAGYVGGIEELRKQIDIIQREIADYYDEIDGKGFDKKFVRKAVANRGKPKAEREADEEAVYAYETAIEKGFSSRARVETAKSALPAHDPETGELHPQAKASDDNGGTSAIAGAPMTGEASRPSVGGGTDAPIPHSSAPTSSPEQAKPEADSSSASGDPFEPLAFLAKKEHVLRPHCQFPELCAGYGRNHCGMCRKAMAESEGA